MSKERAQRRAERELLAEQRRNEQLRANAKAAAKARRRSRFSWLHGGSSKSRVDARVRERRAVIGSAVLVIVVLTWVVSRSIGLTLGVLIAAAVATPAVVTLMSDKRR